MATQPNAGRDIETDILRVLAEAHLSGGALLTVREIRDAMGPPAVSTTTIRSHCRGMSQWYGRRPFPQRPWVMESDGPPARCYAITDEGLRVAEARGLARKADQ